MGRFTAHLYVTGLFLASLVAPFLATPDVLREDVLRGLEIGRTFAFWVPAVLFACLYREPGEGWLPSGRGRLLLRMVTAFFGAALGVTLQVATLDAYRDRVDAQPQDEAVALLQADVAGPEGARSRSAAPAIVIRTHSTSR